MLQGVLVLTHTFVTFSGQECPFFRNDDFSWTVLDHLEDPFTQIIFTSSMTVSPPQQHNQSIISSIYISPVKI